MTIEQNPAVNYWWPRLQHQLSTEHFTQSSVAHYRRITRSFLRYLQVKSISVEAAQPSHVSAYLRAQLSGYRCRHHSRPGNLAN